MKEKLWRFTDNFGSFESQIADKIKTLYFPLANETLMSSITPDLHGDIKTGQHSFLLEPVSRIDLLNSKVSRNFWIYIDKNKAWSATGVSKNLQQIQKDKFKLEAGLLWHKVTRENKKIGLSAEILSFVPAGQEPVEIMQVKLTNITSRKMKFIPYAAIPIYCRSANNLHDHRQVTSLLQRVTKHKFGIIACPGLVFDERGHRPNKTNYFVLGWDEKFVAPEYLYPTQEEFCGEAGDLEAPACVFNNILPDESAPIQGKEAMGGLRFRTVTLKSGQSRSYMILMGMVEDKNQIPKIIRRFNSLKEVKDALETTQEFWRERSSQISISSGNADFDNWFRWVNIQPTLRRIFGNSFLPDFDYGRGGRGWRDLWQDCLGLILNHPQEVRKLLINNFSGVRIDGSNATIIGKSPGEFISDRNNIRRVWMDHGIWPLLTLDLYLNETGDFDILFEQTTYFRNHEIYRAQKIDSDWGPAYGNKLKTVLGKIYTGTILEHLLVQSLVQFFNIGSHNFVRLEGADWNDGLDMAGEFGESVAFSCMYAYCLKLLAQILQKSSQPKIKLAQELTILFNRIDYNSIQAKQQILERYFNQTKSVVSGKRIDIDTLGLAEDLEKKSDWMMEHIRKKEWLAQGFFNGYYDNRKNKVEGIKGNTVRMILASQVFPIMSGVAQSWQIDAVIKSSHRYLWDKKIKGYHLNTDFQEGQLSLGRAFSFVYGDKENGAFFNHMIVMFAYCLYKRGYAKEGFKVLSSIYDMAVNSAQSKIYPCLPEYFNLQGRGMYSYLTGSASWFVLTMLTQVFGICGLDGNLLIEPKLRLEHFKDTRVITITRNFAERVLEINFSNPKRLDWPRYKIIKVSLNTQDLPVRDVKQILIRREKLLKLTSNRTNRLNIILG
jgi:cellobiose phosphorylase